MKILVTAFDPFNNEKINPALEAVQRLPDVIGEHTITKIEIPTIFHECCTVLQQQLQLESYDAVLAIGQAGGRYNITIERIGINVDDARIPDNQGNQPIDQVIQEHGAPAYFSNMPVKRLTQAMIDAGIPASLSNTAGTFVCNHLLYQLGYLHATSYPKMQFGFIQVPFVPEQVINKPNTPSMSLDMIVKGLKIAIATLSNDSRDDLIALGETH
ncbi:MULTISPECIES: pyroglutamyl-peptidase I [unclassified Staphylococcus]|uniref:pyroglutamyl-peptidase I n=1 Tax=unclassified Staphylococcus TaxID=91994 RepID=UPI0021D13EA5|nr:MULTISPECIES: pyroglutamyl-peptidase I [unclassified Staphylococcus]UXR77487.1 pyroglutamyl-peptidase I [Staphylococcus sp. IVB6227]UXR83371.1 pyroglutamyl-peptidase I [Staphylococcus sp. IVB6214]